MVRRGDDHRRCGSDHCVWRSDRGYFEEAEKVKEVNGMNEKEKKDLTKFKELMQEVAKLNERDREKVSIYAQGVMAAASTSKEKSA